MSFGYRNREYPGGIRAISDTNTGEVGLVTAEQLTVTGQSNLNDVHINGNLTLQNTSIVDVLDSIVYSDADAIINLNVTYAGAALLDSGLRIYRGAAKDQAYLRYADTALGDPGVWSVGVGLDTLQIARKDPLLLNNYIPIYNSVSDSLVGSSALQISSGILTNTYPFEIRHTGANNSTFSNDSYVSDLLSIAHRTAGVIDNYSEYGFRNITYHAVSYDNTPTIGGLNIIALNSIMPSSDLRYLFNDCFGFHTTGVIDTIKPFHNQMGIEATTSLLITTPNVYMTGDLDVTGNLNVGSVSFTTISAEKRNYTIPGGFNRIPVIGGWTGDIDITGSGGTFTTNVSPQLRSNEFSYEVLIAYTLVAEVVDGEQYKVLCPINVHNDMNKIRNLYGILRRKATPVGVPLSIQPIPQENIKVVDRYQIDPVYLTLANLAGFDILEINVMGVSGGGYFELVVTIVTNYS
jgi:hypothetical protein